MTTTSDKHPTPARSTLFLAPLGAVLAIAAALLPKLSLIACFITLLGCLFFRENRARQPLLTLLATIVSILGSTVGLGRFIVTEAIPGIAEGGKAAVDRSAVSGLRQIVVAEDALRRGAFVDPDHDGIGSAGSLRELAGLVPLRGHGFLNPPALDYTEAQVVSTPNGPAIEVGAYLYIVCLPGSDGALTADPNAALNEEEAERRFVAYAWPLATGLGSARAFCIDEHERIWASSNQQQGTARYAGPNFPPACDAVFKDADEWRTWMNKKPREALPGDSQR